MSLYFDNNKLFDAEGHLTGLITVKDFVKTEQYPDCLLYTSDAADE